MVKIEDITDEMIHGFWFITQISSGPRVYVYYDDRDDSIKSSFSKLPNVLRGVIIFTYSTMDHMMLSESDLKFLIKTSIINFLLPYHRSDRIESLLD
jgi:hypothetical protein